MQTVFTPSKLGEYLSIVLKRDKVLENVVVEGEVTEYTRNQKTGHHYFTLKDADVPMEQQNSSYGRREPGIIGAILFSTQAGFVRQLPEKGMKLRAVGQVVTYAGRSIYQLQCKHYEQVGLGGAHQLFLEMRDKLGRQGYFDPGHKKRIPTLPKSVALLTASTGDAVHDMIDAIQGKCPTTQIKIVPTPVQGKGAEETMALAIDWVNRHRIADVIVVGRGGGAEEDLKAYNTERLAVAIYRSQIPVVSAVGHEKNHVISDNVADIFVATPSRVKDLFLDVAQEKQDLKDGTKYLQQVLYRLLERREQELQQLALSPIMQNPSLIFKEKEQQLGYAQERLQRIMESTCERAQQETDYFAKSLEDLSLPQVLRRGYAVAQKEDGTIISSVQGVEEGETFTLVLADGEVQVTVTGKSVS